MSQTQIEPWSDTYGDPDEVPALAMTEEEIRSWIEAHEWRFAKTMPSIPHWYVVRSKTLDDDGFVRFAIHIRRHGYAQKFGERTFVYFEIDDFKYWTMGSLKQMEVIINRAKIASPDRAVASSKLSPSLLTSEQEVSQANEISQEISLTQIAELLRSQEWIFAETMPHNPHWYTLRYRLGSPAGFY